MTLMERPRGLILSILSASLVHLSVQLSETARLEISGIDDKTNQIRMQETLYVTTECKCNKGEIMKFNVSDEIKKLSQNSISFRMIPKPGPKIPVGAKNGIFGPQSEIFRRWFWYHSKADSAPPFFI